MDTYLGIQHTANLDRLAATQHGKHHGMNDLDPPGFDPDNPDSLGPANILLADTGLADASGDGKKPGTDLTNPDPIEPDITDPAPAVNDPHIDPDPEMIDPDIRKKDTDISHPDASI